MKYFISVGEVSGDIHASYIVKAIKEESPSALFYGAGGDNLKKEGVEIIQDIEEMAVMGITEALGKYRFLKRLAERYIRFIIENKIENIILVDYGGFNLHLLKKIKKLGLTTKVYYYIPPKLWVWGEKRIKSLALADHILVIFPFELEFYKSRSVDVVYFGNPLVDKFQVSYSKGEKILLLPGSREQEIKSILPIMLECVKLAPNEEFLIKFALKSQVEKYRELIKSYKNITITDGKTSLSQAVAISKCAVAASGTVTLELSLLGIPTVVCYKFSLITELLARRFIKIKYVSLPNIILGKEVYKELLQKDFTAEKILKEIENIRRGKENIVKELSAIRELLGGGNIVEKYAKFIVEEKV